jgi:hypothetical protein
VREPREFFLGPAHRCDTEKTDQEE